VLASASPRRRAILAALGLAFDIVEADVDERILPDETPEQAALRLAVAKARAGAAVHSNCIALGADTVVAVGARALGKPASAGDAVETLRRLRGRSHRVLTGVAAAVASDDGQPAIFSRLAATSVWMRDYTDDAIREYVASGDPLDKAGSYAIQAPIFRPVERIEGCFLTVVGLPLPEVLEVLALAGLPVPPITAAALAGICPSCTDAARLL